MSSEQMLKEGDSILQQCEARNGDELLFFTNKQQVYKSRACEFDDTKASVLGDYLPAKLGFDEGEVPLAMAVTRDYKGYMLFFFQNGKAAKVDLSAYQTKTRRKKLLSAFSDKSETAAIFQLGEEMCIRDSFLWI